MGDSTIRADQPLAIAVVDAIRSGDVEALQRLLGDHPGLASASIADDATGTARTLLHVATDWPGHFASAAQTIRVLIAAGADVDARFTGPHSETPLHWAASSDDVEAIDALVDAGADIEATGAVVGGGTPLGDAVAFGQWQAARRLVERGAQTALWQAAALGLMDRVEAFLAATQPPPRDEITEALWCACHGGQRVCAEYLLEHGADPDWVGYDDLTALDVARRSGADDVVAWLRERGAKGR